MRAFTELTQQVLNDTLFYNPLTGKLVWKPRDRSLFRSDVSHKQYHKRFVGKPALTADNGEGYLTGTVLGHRVKAHQVIWVMTYGQLPEKGYEIDHINGVRSDNRLENLRAVSKHTNGKNQRLQSRNTTGVAGVSWYKPTKKWLVRINIDKETVCGGYFTSFQEACEIRAMLALQNGYHQNHGNRKTHEL